MSLRALYPRAWALTALLTIVPILWSAQARAGDHRVYVQPVQLLYPQAPVVMSYSPPVQAFQVVTVCVPAPTAPATGPPSQPGSNATSLPSGTAPAPSAGTAPASNWRIKAAQRIALWQDLKDEYKKQTASGAGKSKVDVEKALRDWLRTNYAKLVPCDVSLLYPSEVNDIDGMLDRLFDSSGGDGQAPPPPPLAPPPAGCQNNVLLMYALPVYVAPAQPVMVAQPAAPVQFYLPVQPRHHLFGGW
jgi:hypothetical protein